MSRLLRILGALLALAGVLCAAGCVTSTDYSIVVEYKPSLDIPQIMATPNAKSITIAKFEDDRADQTGIAGAKNGLGNIAIRYTSSQPLAVIVQDAFAKYFEAAGFRVTKADFWDLNPETLTGFATDLLMGGQVKAFWAENWPDPSGLGGHGFSSVKFKVVVVGPRSTIVWSGELEGGTTTSSLWGGPSLKEMIEKALARAVEATLRDEGLRTAVAAALQES